MTTAMRRWRVSFEAVKARTGFECENRSRCPEQLAFAVVRALLVSDYGMLTTDVLESTELSIVVVWPKSLLH